MKNKCQVLAPYLAGILLAVIVGCTSGVQPAPTALDRTLFTITTNVVTQTNFIPHTNFVFVPIVVTNVDHQTITNTVTNATVQIIPVIHDQTNYTYVPAPAVTGTIGTVGAVAGPWGALAGVVLSGILGVWGSLKSKQANTAETVAANSLQIIATAKAIIAALPNGATLAKEFNAFVAAHQADENLAQEIATYVSDINPSAATGAASTVLAAAVAPIQTGLPNVPTAVKV